MFAGHTLEITPTTVFEGKSFELSYQASTTIDTCIFSISGFPTNINIFKGAPKNSKYDFIGDYATGLCAIEIFNATKDNNGPASAKVSYPRHIDEGQDIASTNVKVMPLKVLQG